MTNNCRCAACFDQTEYSWNLTVDNKTWFLVEQRPFVEPEVLAVVRDNCVGWSYPSWSAPQSTWAARGDP